MGMEKNGNDNRGKFPDNMFQSCVTIRSLCVQSVAFRVSYRLFSAISIIFGANFIYLQGGPENSTNRYFATICSRITQFHQILRKNHCPPFLYQLVEYSLINSRNWIHVMSDVTVAHGS